MAKYESENMKEYGQKEYLLSGSIRIKTLLVMWKSAYSGGAYIRTLKGETESIFKGK